MPRGRARAAAAAAAQASVPASNSSLPSFPLTANGIAQLKSRKHPSAPPVAVTLRVESLHRFLIDAKYQTITTVAAPIAADPDIQPDGAAADGSSSSNPAAHVPSPLDHSDSGYDAVLSDGSVRSKVLLSPSLTPLVEQGGLLPGTVVTCYDSCVRYDETVIGGAGFVLVRALKIRRRESEEEQRAAAAADVRWGSAEGSRERQPRPLISSRSYYLSLWNDGSLEWEPEAAPPAQPEEEKAEGQGGEEAQAVSVSGFHIHDHQESLITIIGAVSGDYTGSQTLIARVVSKSRVVHFGKVSSSAAAPFFFELLLLDATGTVKASVWNSLVSVYYRQLQVGQVVALSGFRLRGRQDKEEVELSINPYNPTGSIAVVQQSEWEVLEPPLPPVPFTLTGVEAARFVADGQHVDLCGVCVWCGPMQREYSRAHHQFYCHRFLLLADDGGSNSAVAVKLYANSQDAAVAALQTGDVLLITNAQTVTTRELSSSRDQRSVYAQSTQFSQLFRQQQLDSLDDDELRDRGRELAAWRDLVDWQHADWRSLWQWGVGMEPLLSKQPDAPLSICPVHELAAIAASLRFIQIRSLVVQGIITAINLLPAAYQLEEQEGEQALMEEQRQQGGARGRRGRRGRPAKRGRKAAQSPASNTAVADAAGAGSFSPPLPTSPGTTRLLELTVSDLNREHETRLSLCIPPVPYAAQGGNGSVAFDMSSPQARRRSLPSPASLPPALSVLLQLLPSDSVSLKEVEQALAGFIPKRKHGRPPGKRAATEAAIASSQPLPSRVTRSQAGLRAHSQEPARGRRKRPGQERKEQEEEVERKQQQPQPEMDAQTRERLTQSACAALLQDRHVLLSVALYRSAHESVEASVSSILSISAEQDEEEQKAG